MDFRPNSYAPFFLLFLQEMNQQWALSHGATALHCLYARRRPLSKDRQKGRSDR